MFGKLGAGIGQKPAGCNSKPTGVVLGQPIPTRSAVPTGRTVRACPPGYVRRSANAPCTKR
jgi:hypothetical protein